MIKNLHFIWIGKDKPHVGNHLCLVSNCKTYHDFTIHYWTEDNLPMSDYLKHSILKLHYDKGNYALVADYIRLDILYNYGGLYLDHDIYSVKSIEELIDKDTLNYSIENPYSNFPPGNVIYAPLHHKDLVEAMRYLLDPEDSVFVGDALIHVNTNNLHNKFEVKHTYPTMSYEIESLLHSKTINYMSHIFFNRTWNYGENLAFYLDRK